MMLCRNRKLSFIFRFILLFVFSFSLCLCGAEVVKAKQPTKEMSSIAALLLRMASSQHYSGVKYNEELSAMIFDDYMKSLDPMKMFFLRTDVDNLSVSRFRLASQIQKGNVAFAFDAFNLLLLRMGQYEEFAQNFLKGKPDLNTNMEYSLDHKKDAYPATMVELEERWKKKLINDLIVLTLADRAEEQEARENPKKDGAVEDAKEKKTPVERLSYRITRTMRYYREMESMDVLEIYLTSAVQVLDPHSCYMSPKTDEDFDIDMSLSLTGIGAVLTSEDGYVKIVEIIAGGPADLSGELKAGDRIIAVRQEQGAKVDVIDMPLNKVVKMIRGKEKTKVYLTVLKAGRGLSTPVQITITRAKVDIKDSAAKGEIKVHNGKRIGVIGLSSFYLDFSAARRGDENYRSASRDVKKILESFNKEKLDGVVIDLRSNGGGSLLEALKLTGLFIKDGPVVQVKGRHETEIDRDDDGGLLVYDGPLAVLINQFSASSSEIFSAAIHDYNRGILTGDVCTHGKGTVQFVGDLSRYMPFLTGRRFSAGSIRLTNAKFYRINGESTQLKGIEADVPFPSFSEFMEASESELNHAMPWDRIPPTEYETYKAPWAMTDALRAELRKRSEARQKTDPDFQLLRTWIEEFRVIKERKTVSLNLEKRWVEYQKQEKMRKEQEALYDPRSKLKDKKKKEKDKDLYLTETMNVLSDLIDLSRKKD